MVLKVIYVIRHGYRSSWSVNAATGIYTASVPSPTGIPSDPALSSYGVDQAKHLSAHLVTQDPPIDVVYSSPWYRCLQTLQPSIEKLGEEGAQRDGRRKVRVENGISEFFGQAPFVHPQPAALDTLSEHFDFLDQTYLPTITPDPRGESIAGIHNRTAYALHQLIAQADADPSQPQAILLCTHCASMICIGRALTGQMPDDYSTIDFRNGTCSLTKYVRRTPYKTSHDVEPFDPAHPERIPTLEWRGGRGVQGGWDCTVNGDCSFLPNGEERTWHFTGDESFFDTKPVSNGGSCSKL